MYRYSRPGSNTADLRTDKNAAVSGKCDMGGGGGGGGTGAGGGGAAGKMWFYQYRTVISSRDACRITK